MDAQILKVVGLVAGIGGIAIGAFIILFREVISGASVSMLGRPDVAPQTTDNKGNFSFILETASGNFQGNVQITHSGYLASFWLPTRAV